MIAAGEFVVFLIPLLAFVLWRVAVARGMDGPAPRQLAIVVIAVLTMGAFLVLFAAREALPPGRYVPAQVRNGQIVPGHSE